MSVSTHHPLYDEFIPDQKQMRDTYRGQRIVKEEGTKYLPLTSGMVDDGARATTKSKGGQAYVAYRTRAIYPDTVKEAVEALLGVMHHKVATIELPESMEFLRADASIRNESLQMMLRRINEEQLVAGRLGLLTDVADSGERKDLPYLVIYHAEHVINWDEGRSDGIEIQNLNLVVIDETEDERKDDLTWKRVRKFRVLLLTENASTEAAEDAVDVDPDETAENIPEGQGVYQAGVFRVDTDVGSSDFDPNKMQPLMIKGRTLDKLPFVFCNTKDVVAEPDNPPLLGLSDLSLTIYRGEADYRQGLFLQGQDTLVIIGQAEDEDDQRTGAGAVIRIANPEGSASYIGVDSTGLAEMRSALENDYNRAGQKGAQLLDSVASGGNQQSGDALRIRVAAKTATLNQIALTGAFALESILKITAEWMGADPEQVSVVPNLDFADDQMSGKELVDLMAARQIGAPIALETIHATMEARGMTDLTFEEELKVIEGEEDIDLGAADATDEGDPVDDDPDPDTED